MILEVKAQLLGESGEPIIAYFHQEVVLPQENVPDQAIAISQAMLDQLDLAKASIGVQLSDLHKMLS